MIALGVDKMTLQKALRALVPCVFAFMAVATVYVVWRGRSR